MSAGSDKSSKYIKEKFNYRLHPSLSPSFLISFILFSYCHCNNCSTAACSLSLSLSLSLSDTTYWHSINSSTGSSTTWKPCILIILIVICRNTKNKIVLNIFQNLHQQYRYDRDAWWLRNLKCMSHVSYHCKYNLQNHIKILLRYIDSIVLIDADLVLTNALFMYV